MSLFKNDKNPCPICGAPTPRLFPTRVEDKPICGNCKDEIRMDPDKQNALTLDTLRTHLEYRKHNHELREQMNVTRKLDLVYALVMHNNLCLDDDQRLWYIDGCYNPPVFRFEDLTEFTFCEDKRVIVRITPNGVERNTSVVEGMLHDAGLIGSMADLADSLNRLVGNHPKEEKENHTYEHPVDDFHFYFTTDNPYVTYQEFNFSAPTLTDGDRMEYMKDYGAARERIEEVIALVQDVMNVREATGSEETAAAPAQVPDADPISEIKRYKELLDADIISREEFDAKKKQLMGI